MFYSIAVELCSKLEDHVQPDEAVVLLSWLVVLHSQFIHQLTYGLIYLALSPDVSYSRSTALVIRSTSLTTKSLPARPSPEVRQQVRWGSPLGKPAGEVRWGSPLPSDSGSAAQPPSLALSAPKEGLRAALWTPGKGNRTSQFGERGRQMLSLTDKGRETLRTSNATHETDGIGRFRSR